MISGLTVAVLGVVLTMSGAAPVAASGHDPKAASVESPATPRAMSPRARRCGPVDRAFTPRTVEIPGVVDAARVLALGRDRRGVPRTPPLTARGKWQFAWDRDSGNRPGGPRGVIRLNAHTYPASAGTALGNRLLAGLRTGAVVRVVGANDQRLCYRVTKRVSIRAEQSSAAYFDDWGRSRLGILVCSGKRRGPGDWSERTIWYAAPVGHS